MGADLDPVEALRAAQNALSRGEGCTAYCLLAQSEFIPTRSTRDAVNAAELAEEQA